MCWQISNRLSRTAQRESSWPAIDLTVALTTFPALVVLTLLLDFNLSADWAQRRNSTIVVLSLAAAFAAISVFTIGYVAYRLGFRLWAGPLDGGVPADVEARATEAAEAQMYADMEPPSYEWVMQLQHDELDANDAELPKYEESMCRASTASNGIVLHM